MALPVYLAMTPQEIAACPQLPEHIAWLACHFSPYGTGLAGLPQGLPPGSLLILDDRIPVWHHDPALVARQLAEAVEQTEAAGVLVDFQGRSSRLKDIAAAVLEAIPTAAVTAGLLDEGAVLVPPIPPGEIPADCLKPWEERDIWLELSPSPIQITVDEKGSRSAPYTGPLPETVFRDEALCCSYGTEVFHDRGVFTLFRTAEDIKALLQAVPNIHPVGLYQELKDKL